MKGDTSRRVAGLMLCVAAAIWISAFQGSLAAKSCQEYCDADYAACQTACTDTCGGYDNTCLSPCLSDCHSQYYTCSSGATTCNVQVMSVCDVQYYWDNGQAVWESTSCTTYMK
jgi:hypothetical protein